MTEVIDGPLTFCGHAETESVSGDTCNEAFFLWSEQLAAATQIVN